MPVMASRKRCIISLFVGSGGGYRGMNEGSMYLDGALPYRITDMSVGEDSEADVIDSGMYQPKKNFDVSGRASDLNNVNLLQYYENLGSYREEALSGFVHEYLHNWEAQHIIAGPNTALWKQNGQTGAIGPELVSRSMDCGRCNNMPTSILLRIQAIRFGVLSEDSYHMKMWFQKY
jgi:hypothetical protein